MPQTLTDYEPKVGSQLQIEVLNLERGELIETTTFEVVEGQGGALAARLVGAPPAAAEKVAKKEKGAKGGSPELEVAKFVWEFIKDNKPVANRTSASTSVLYRDTDGLDYHEAISFQSQTFQYRLRDATIKDWVVASADMRLEGMYRAVPSRDDIPAGHFLPSIYFNVIDMDVPFSFSLSASADVTPPANVGTAEMIQPRLSVYAKLDMEWLFVSHPTTVQFQADGLRGGVLGYFGGGGHPVS